MVVYKLKYSIYHYHHISYTVVLYYSLLYKTTGLPSQPAAGIIITRRRGTLALYYYNTINI